MQNTTESDDIVRRDGNKLVIGNPNTVTTMDAKNLKAQINSASRYDPPVEKICIVGDMRLTGDAAYLFGDASYLYATSSTFYKRTNNDTRTVKEIEGLQRIDTSEVTSMEGMFCGMFSLESVEGIETWDTHNVKSMRAMFNECENLSAIDVSGFNTSNVTNMSSMFHACSSVKSLDLSHFDMSKTVNARGMCSSCLQLENASIASWNAPQLESMDSMFHLCKSLQELNTTGMSINGNQISGMFSGCKSIETLDLSGIRGTTQCSSFAFDRCSSLKMIDLSNLDARPDSYVPYMFTKCDLLETVKLTPTMREELSECHSLPPVRQNTRTPIAFGDGFDDESPIETPYPFG